MNNVNMKAGLVGCGFVSQLYGSTAFNHTDTFVIKGCFDLIKERTERFARRYRAHPYRSMEELLGDKETEIIIVLTTAANHYDLVKRALSHGKHVYCEKPLAMRTSDALELAEIAKKWAFNRIRAV